MPHIHEKVDFVADVYIVHNGKVLLRKHDKYKIWLPVGGHIEPDEDPNQTAVREAKEEVGLDVTIVPEHPVNNFEHPLGGKELIPPRFLNRHRINETHEHISLGYFGTTESGKVQQGVEREKSDDIRWLTAEELDDPALGISEQVKYYAHAALKALS